MSKKQIIPIGSLVIGLVFGLVMLATHLLVKPPAPPAELEGVLRSPFRLLTPFQLQSHNRAPINESSLQGKWSFVFFGYLSCPDICPITLHELSSFYALVKDQLGKEPDDLQVIFVSVDPERDSPAKLAEYVSHFNRKFISASAGKASLDRFAAQLGAGYVIEQETASGQYLVAHTSAIFVIDPLGRLVATFSQPHYASTLASQYQKIKAYFSGSG